MQYWHTSWWREYRIEQEAYNPGSGTSCDRLVPWSVTIIDLPYTGYSLANGCGNSSYQEELKIELDENAFSSGQWGAHRVSYTRYGSGAGEVNYSFSHNSTPGDSWLGKLSYDSQWDMTSTNPPNLTQ